jgi:F-type H+-transporting ATPase subunit a
MTPWWSLLAAAAVDELAPHAAEHSAATHGAHEGGDILMHHMLDQPFLGLPSKHLVFFVIVALLVILVVRLALRTYDKDRVPHGLGAAVEGLVLFVRDEIAEKSIGHDGHRFVPLLLNFFFFVLVAALFGLLPFSSTSTGNISVTLALALVSFLAQQWGGISNYGLIGHFKNLVPPGIPMWLLPLIIPVEILGMLTKPFALMVRLFANMLAGHLVITALLLLIPAMAGVSALAGYAIVPVSLGLSLFIMLLEILVAFVQAYIFTMLSAIFIGMYAHPAH